MKNNWLGKVLGESSQPTTPVKPAANTVRQVIGEEAPPSEDPAPSNAAAEPAAEPTEIPAEAEVEAGGEDRVNDPVQTLVSLWTSGAKMDVAVKLLTEPVSNRDFVQLALAIGNEGALELGQILDDMQAGVGDEGGEGAEGEDAVLSRVANIRGQRAKSPEQEEREDFRERHAEGDVHAINQAEQ